MNIKILSEIIDGKILNEENNRKIKEIKIDSRNINKGDAFIALIGTKFDGHDYIADVLKRKPSVIVVCKEINVKTKIPIILVKNTYDALMKIGRFFRNKYDIPVIAVTGSVGKTTTKEIISEILSKKYKVLKSEKNYNNHIGLPLTLAKLNSDYNVCVLEMGMNHPGEITNLSKMTKPNIGIITNIGTAHIGNLGSQKNIFRAKMEIIDGMEDGLLVINGNDRLLKKAKYSNILKCGKKLKPYDIKVGNEVSFKLKINKQEHVFYYNSLNKSLIMNFVIAIQIGLLFNIDIEDIKEVLSNYKMPKERMNIITKNTTTIINDCYNASLESVLGSIDVLKQANNKKIIILGDILELGKYTIKIHKKIGRYLKNIKDAEILLVGKNIKKIKNKNYKYFDNNNEVINYLQNKNLNNSTILIKGSRKMCLEEVTNYLLETL